MRSTSLGSPGLTLAVCCPELVNVLTLAGQVMVGAAQGETVTEAEGFPGPVSLDVTGPVVLFFTPGVAPVTVTLNWH